MASQDLVSRSGGEDPVLAEMLLHQLLILGRPRPERLVTVVGDAVVLAVITWPQDPGAETMERVGERLCELVEARTGRRVTSFGPGTTGRHAVASFGLGTLAEDPREAGEAVIAWSRQTRRGARRNRHEAGVVRMEARFLRAESRECRSVLRRLGGTTVSAAAARQGVGGD